MSFRIETDSMGEVKVPSHQYFGAQTQRSLENFPIGNEVMPKELIKAMATVKQAAAKANYDLGFLDKEIYELIFLSSEKILSGQYLEQFPLKVWQTGSGTQTNMNLNEVIASLANEKAGGNKGDKSPVHPNDHVNMSQSTNDVFPTAMHVSTACLVQEKLLPALSSLKKTFLKKTEYLKSFVKIGRTHLQDATPVTLGQEMSAYAYQLSASEKEIENALDAIYELAIGGTAVGTGLNTHPDYAQKTSHNIAIKTALPFRSSENKFALLGAHDALVSFSGLLNTLACALMKIANDIRWMASGPRCGFFEIFIAENEPGSSIMPGKVNPTQAEALTMVCCQVMGNHTAVTVAGSQGNFELNVYKPVIIRNILHSVEILADSMNSFNEKCAMSIEPNKKRLDELTKKSLMLVTCLSPYIGYDMAAHVAKKAFKEDKSLKEVCLELSLMSEKEFDERVDAKAMLAPNRK